MSAQDFRSDVVLAMAPVGNPGNASDPRTGFGRVDDEYNLS
jgi:hypothetical protein